MGCKTEGPSLLLALSIKTFSLVWNSVDFCVFKFTFAFADFVFLAIGGFVSWSLDISDVYYI